MLRSRFCTSLFSLVVAFIACSTKPSENEFIRCAIKGDTVVVRSALADGMDPNFKVGDKTALIFMAINNRKDIAQALLEHGADVNARDELGWTALIWAANEGHAEVAQILLDRGADVNAKGKVGWTALMVAAKNGKANIVKILLGKGADLNAKDEMGMTALQYGISASHDDIVQLLRKAGARE